MKNILVTGCSRGIGFEIVKNFAKHRNINVLAIARNTSGLNKLKKQCYTINKAFKLHTLSVDLADLNSIDLVVQHIKSELNSTVDALINNAGLLVKKSFTKITHKDLEDSFKVNCFSPFILIQNLIPFFNSNAHILSISSMGGIQGSKKFPDLSAYSTSKSTLITLTECLAEEFKMTDLVFNCLALGAVQTEMLKKAFPGYDAPLSAEDMGQFIVDFCFNGKKYFNGQTIPVSLTTP